MTPGLHLGRNGPAEIGAFFRVGAGPLKGAKLAKPSSPSDPFAAVEQYNIGTDGARRWLCRSGVPQFPASGTPYPCCNQATGGEAVPGGRAVARLQRVRGYRPPWAGPPVRWRRRWQTRRQVSRGRHSQAASLATGGVAAGQACGSGALYPDQSASRPHIGR